MHQHSGAPEPKWNRQITRCIFPPDSEKSSGNKTREVMYVVERPQWCIEGKLCGCGCVYVCVCMCVYVVCICECGCVLCVCMCVCMCVRWCACVFALYIIWQNFSQV